MLRFLLRLLLIAACFSGVSAVAQEAVAKKSGGLSVRALLLVPSGQVTSLHPLSGAEVGDEVLIGAGGLSDAFKPTARQFSLAVPDAKQEIGFRAVAKVVLPELGKDFIILLEPAGATYKIHVVNGKEPRFGADSVLFFNASETTLGGTLGATRVLIKPRVAVFAKAPPRGEKPYYQVTFYRPDEGKARPFANTRWPHRESGRCYVFFYRNAVGRLTYQAVDEEIKPLAPAE
jgi:hypothetical protein